MKNHDEIKKKLLQSLQNDKFGFVDTSTHATSLKVSDLLYKISPRWLENTSFAWNDKVYMCLTDGGRFRKPIDFCATAAHEYQHLCDARGLTKPVFYALYFSPQILATLSLFGFWWPWMTFFLLFLLPLPSPFRLWLEWRATLTGFAMRHYMDGYLTSNLLADRLKSWSSMKYFFMLPFSSLVWDLFAKQVEKISQGNYPDYTKNLLRRFVEL